MMKTTRLRYISAKKLDVIMTAVSSLPFKIEIKGSEFANGRFYILFVLPENPKITFRNLDL